MLSTLEAEDLFDSVKNSLILLFTKMNLLIFSAFGSSIIFHNDSFLQSQFLHYFNAFISCTMSFFRTVIALYKRYTQKNGILHGCFLQNTEYYFICAKSGKSRFNVYLILVQTVIGPLVPCSSFKLFST